VFDQAANLVRIKANGTPHLDRCEIATVDHSPHGHLRDAEPIGYLGIRQKLLSEHVLHHVESATLRLSTVVVGVISLASPGA
jgi:hypothetical protein